MVRVLINDGTKQQGLDILRSAGIECDTTNRNAEALLNEIRNYDGLIVYSNTKVTSEVIRAGAEGKLRIVGRAGVGIDNIDVDAATKSGVLVKSAPNGNTNSTAEHALALMFAVSRKIPQAHNDLKWGRWQKKRYEGNELSGKTLGIIGCGRIGRRLCELVRGLDMEVIGYDKKPVAESRVVYMSKDDVFKTADYLSVHVSGTREVVTKRDIAKMKPTAILINDARGENVDYNALFMALFKNKIRGAGLDVYPDEPTKDGDYFGSSFRSLDNVVMTSHLAASTEEARIRTAVEMAESMRDYFLEGSFAGAVNAIEKLQLENKKVYSMTVCHKYISGIFTQIDRLCGANNINIMQIQSRFIGPKGNKRAHTVYLLQKEPSQEVIESVRDLKYVESVKV